MKVDIFWCPLQGVHNGLGGTILIINLNAWRITFMQLDNKTNQPIDLLCPPPPRIFIIEKEEQRDLRLTQMIHKVSLMVVRLSMIEIMRNKMSLLQNIAPLAFHSSKTTFH